MKPRRFPRKPIQHQCRCGGWGESPLGHYYCRELEPWADELDEFIAEQSATVPGFADALAEWIRP